MIGVLDVGGTKLLVGCSVDGASLRNTVRRATPAEGDMAAVMGDMLDEVRGGAALSGIAGAVPGPFDRETGVLLNPPGLTEAWHQLQLAERLRERFGCPVALENDGNCAALAEARWGAGRDGRLVVYFTVSTGVGTGVVREGRLVVERRDQEGGHQVVWPARLGGPPCDCGGSGCLEAIASGRAIAKRFGLPAAEVEDPAAWAEVGYWLGVGAVNATALLDCDCIVFGGGVASARWPELEPAILEAMAEHLRLQPMPHLHVAELGDDRNLRGALLLLS